MTLQYRNTLERRLGTTDFEHRQTIAETESKARLAALDRQLKAYGLRWDGRMIVLLEDDK